MSFRLSSYVQRSESVQSAKDSVFEFLSQKIVLTAVTVLPVMALFGTVTILPIIWAFYAGFYEIPVFNPEWQWIGLGNYVSAITSPEFWDSAWLSTVYAVGSVVSQVVIGTGLALLVNRSFRFDKLSRALVLLPYLIPTAVVGFVALWMGNSTWGVINIIPMELGLIDEPINWFGDIDLVMFSVIMTGTWKWASFVAIFVLARLQSIPEGYYEAAKMAGATRYQVFRDITLPNLKSVLFIVVFLRGIWMFNKFDVIYVLTQGGPAGATETAPIFAYKQAFDYGNLGLAAAISVCLFSLLVVVGIIYFARFNPEQEVRVE